MGFQQCFSDFRLYIGADAHSGATAADFNRVPVLSIPEQNTPGPAIEISPFQRTKNTNTKPPNKGQEKKIRNNQQLARQRKNNRYPS
jgi:hypothetical protein